MLHSFAKILPFSLSKMINIMWGFAVLDGLKYASSHEWVKHEGPVATIGITDHAQVIFFSWT